MALEITYGEKVEDAEIVSLELAKLNSKIDFEEEDELLEVFLSAAIDEVENYTERKIALRKSVISSKDWKGTIRPEVKIDKIEKIEYINEDGEVEEIQEGKYNHLTSANSIKIEKPDDFKEDLAVHCDLGYRSKTIPADIKRAVLLIFSAADTYREDMPVKVNTAAKSLLRAYRKY